MREHLIPNRKIAVTFACIALALSLSACGKSEKQKQAEREAADARWEANLAAAEAERQKTEQDLVKGELARMAALDGKGKPPPPPNPALRPSGMAVNGPGVTQKNMDDAEAGMRKTIELRELPRVKNNLIGTVRNSLPHPETAQFRDVHMNTAHNAACGEVDFEYWPTGSAAVRSGYQKFIIEMAHYRNSAYDSDEGSGIAYHTAVDIDYQNRREKYNELWKKVDCTPDLNF